MSSSRYGTLPGQGMARKEAPACVQNAMMTKDKKPFTYTPDGIDLSQIKSDRMAKRLARNALDEGTSCTKQNTMANQSQLPMQSQPNSVGAATKGMPVQVLPKFTNEPNGKMINEVIPIPPPPPPTQSSSAPPTRTEINKLAYVSNPPKVPPRKYVDPPPLGFRPKIEIPPNPMANLRKVPPPVEKNGFWKDEYVKEQPQFSGDISQPRMDDSCSEIGGKKSNIDIHTQAGLKINTPAKQNQLSTNTQCEENSNLALPTISLQRNNVQPLLQQNHRSNIEKAPERKSCQSDVLKSLESTVRNQGEIHPRPTTGSCEFKQRQSQPISNIAPSNPVTYMPCNKNIVPWRTQRNQVKEAQMCALPLVKGSPNADESHFQPNYELEAPENNMISCVSREEQKPVSSLYVTPAKCISQLQFENVNKASSVRGQAREPHAQHQQQYGIAQQKSYSGQKPSQGFLTTDNQNSRYESFPMREHDFYQSAHKNEFSPQFDERLTPCFTQANDLIDAKDQNIAFCLDQNPLHMHGHSSRLPQAYGSKESNNAPNRYANWTPSQLIDQRCNTFSATPYSEEARFRTILEPVDKQNTSGFMQNQHFTATNGSKTRIIPITIERESM